MGKLDSMIDAALLHKKVQSTSGQTLVDRLEAARLTDLLAEHPEPDFAQGVALLSQLDQQHLEKLGADILREQLLRAQEAERKLQEVQVELTDLQQNPQRAYANLQRVTATLQSEREVATRRLADLEAKLNAAGVRTVPEPERWGRTLLAIFLAVSLGVFLVYLAVLFGGKQPDSKLNITYDLGKIIESFLLGSGALIAGVAYALSTVRRRGE
jgi:uncharacterized protein YigA (DUF484 family)